MEVKAVLHKWEDNSTLTHVTTVAAAASALAEEQWEVHASFTYGFSLMAITRL